jgi:hypothetical protein
VLLVLLEDVLLVRPLCDGSVSVFSGR